MGNFSVERARLRLSDSIDGLDPNANIDAAELCWIDPTNIDANTCRVTPIAGFYADAFRGRQDDDKWFPAAEGLTTVRKLLAHYRRIIKDGADPLGRKLPVIEKKIAILAEVEAVLNVADQSGIYFCIAVSDS